MSNVRYVGKTFVGAQVGLDFGDFENCCFERCTIHYTGAGPFNIVNCQFIEVQWALSQAAQRTIYFLSAIYHGGGDGGKKVVSGLYDAVVRGDLIPKTPTPTVVVSETPAGV